MPKKRLIPFRLLPGSWGLAGRTYAEAEAEYYLEGEELERRLAEIRHSDEPTRLAEKLLALDLKYGHIDQYTYDLKMFELSGETSATARAAIELRHGRIDQYTYDRLAAVENCGDEEACEVVLLAVDLKHGRIDRYAYDRALAKRGTAPDSVERELALLDVDLAHGKISKAEYEKARATLNEEPWVGIIDSGFDLDQGINGLYFEFDWNEYWIEYLRLHGYTGDTDQQIVEAWFADVSRSQTDQVASVPLTPSRSVHIVRDNGTFYS